MINMYISIHCTLDIASIWAQTLLCTLRAWQALICMFWVTSSGCRPTPFTEITSSRYHHKRATTSGIAGRFCRNSAINPTIIMWKVYIKIKELALHLKNSAQPYCQRPTCIWHLCQAKPWLKGASLDFPEALRICLRTPPPIFVQVPDMLLRSSLWQPFKTCALRGVDV